MFSRPPVSGVDDQVANAPRGIVDQEILDMANLPVAGVDMIASDDSNAAPMWISVIQTKHDVSVLMRGVFGEIRRRRQGRYHRTMQK